MFEEMHEEYSRLVKHTAALTADLLSEQSIDMRAHESISRDIETTIDAASDVVEQMHAFAVSEMSHVERRQKVATVSTLKTNVRNLRTEFVKAKSQREKELLFSSPDAHSHLGVNDLSTSDREALLSTTESLNGTSDRLKNSLRVIAETEAVGVDIISELSRSRETLETTKARMVQVDMISDAARRTIRAMNQREVQQKALIYGVVFLSVCVSFVALYRLYGF